MEKCNDSVMRKPHAKDGKPKIKTKLMLPPTFEEEFHGKDIS
jgi:F420-dependent methylenetetrahydromethanopterin dehydrogenase